MAALAMSQGKIQAVLVGCDRMAANGDAANKIGTSGAAIIAHHYGVPVYFLLPSSTIDMTCPTGADIPIELRSPEEIRTMWYAKPMAPEGVKCWNPAFDVTDHSLITAIITEKGVLYPPFDVSLKAHFGKEETHDSIL
jgi:methylthioribose-1-phosphate isomerase